MPLRRRSGPAFRGDLVSALWTVPEATGQAPGLTLLPALPALVVGEVTHRRPGPVRHAFRHRIYQWLIDLDSVPRQPGYLSPRSPTAVRIILGDRRA